MSTSELAKRFSKATERIEGAGQYSNEEIREVQEEFGGAFNTDIPELARQHRFVNDLIEQRAAAQVLEERKKEG